MNPLAAIAGRAMSPVEVQGHLPATPDQVWAVIADPTTYPDWLVGAQRMRSVDEGFPRPGTAFHHSVGPVEEATVDDRSESLESDPPNRLVLDVHVGKLEGIVELLVTAEGDGSRLVFREKPTGTFALATPLLRPAVYARNEKSLRQLRELLSQRTGP